jgi:hypothetical protein
MLANEGESSSTKALEPTASTSSLSPYLKQGSTSAGGAGKRPLNPPPTSLRDLREGQASGHRSVGEGNIDGFTNVSSSERSPHMASPSEQSLRSDREQSLSRESSKNDKTPNTTGLGIGLRQEPSEKQVEDWRMSPTQTKHNLVPPKIIRPSSGSDEDGEREEDATSNTVQYKRASRLNFPKEKETSRMSRSFSFYDPDLVSLMDSITRFESSDEISLDVLPSKGNMDEGISSSAQGEIRDDSVDGGQEDVEAIATEEEKEKTLSVDRSRKTDSTLSLNKISNKMRESMKQARNGHISMDTNFVESILQDLDVTRDKMKTLQRRYDRIRRASQQAAQGFSSAKEEYEQEVQARYDAEAEMLDLKRQLHLQATALTEMTTVKKEQENLQRRSHSVRDSINNMERDLAKLTAERDLTAAEVAELIALQDGRTLPLSGNEDGIKRNLTLRLESIKDRYRQELQAMLSERDTLLIEIEELRQSKEVFAEETQALNSRNEVLNATLAHLSRRVEHAQANAMVGGRDGQASKQYHAPSPSPQGRSNSVPQSGGAGGGGSSTFGGFGFGKQSRQLTPGTHSNMPSTTALDSTGSSQISHSPLPLDSFENVARLAPVPLTKVEAVPKKFKWKKTPKLTAETARTAGHQLAAGIQGVIGPSPPVPPKSNSQQNVSYGHAASPSSLQQQQQQQQQIASLQQQHLATPDQASSSNGNTSGTSNGEVVVKEHLFQVFGVLRPTRCFACQKNMWGQTEMKCNLCNQVCHVRCLQSLPTSCNQPFTRSDEVSDYNGPSMFGRLLAEQVRSEGGDRKVPLVVEKCVQAVEKLGMDYEGIYRKSGGTSQLKIIAQLFDNRQPFNLENRDRFNDISAITSVLKNYFRELPEPLLTFELHERFIECAESKTNSSKKEVEMRELVKALPKEHFDTIKVLIQHLHRVQGKSEENRMNSRNLGVVFGPTLMRSGDPSQEFAHMGGKAMTIEFMIDHPYIFD